MPGHARLCAVIACERTAVRPLCPWSPRTNGRGGCQSHPMHVMNYRSECTAFIPSGLEVASVWSSISVIAGLTACIDHLHCAHDLSYIEPSGSTRFRANNRTGHRAPPACNVVLKVCAYIKHLACVLCWCIQQSERWLLVERMTCEAALVKYQASIKLC